MACQLTSSLLDELFPTLETPAEILYLISDIHNKICLYVCEHCGKELELDDETSMVGRWNESSTLFLLDCFHCYKSTVFPVSGLSVSEIQRFYGD